MLPRPFILVVLSTLLWISGEYYSKVEKIIFLFYKIIYAIMLKLSFKLMIHLFSYYNFSYRA